MRAANILAIDASAEACSVALHVDGVRYERISDTPRTHAQTMLPMIDSLLADAQVSLSDLSGIAVVYGPGSFTGIRIAISVAQGLAYALRMRVTCLSSLQVMAAACLPLVHNSATVVPALDARMGEVYWATFSVLDGKIVETRPAGASALADFASVLSSMSRSETLIAAGSAFSLDSLDVPAECHIDAMCAPDASKMLDALNHFEGVEYDADKLEPLYVRNEVAWEKRQRIRQG